MKILLISHQLDYSGAPIALLRLSESLIRLGHQVHLLSLKPGPLLPIFLAAGVFNFDQASYRAGMFDRVIANTVLSIPYAVNLVGETQELYAWIHESIEFLPLMGASPESLLLNRVAVAGFPSDFQISEFRRYMPKANLIRLRNCVDLSDFSGSAGGADPQAYVCVGAWENRKNQNRLLDLVGQGECRIQIKFVGADCPAESIFPLTLHRFLGRLSLEQAREQICSSKGLISCATAETQNLAAIESMQFGLPVLLSDIPAHRELQMILPDVVLFNPSSLHSFLSGLSDIDSILASASIRSRLRERAISNFGRHSFDLGVAKFVGSYRGGLRHWFGGFFR